MEVKGFRVHDIPSGITTNDLSIYFEKSQNGGTEIEEIYYPLSDNSAVIVFTNDEYKRAFDKDHTLKGNKLVLSRIPVQLFSSTTVHLEQAITQLLDENPPLMRSLENESDMEVMFDAKSMTYKICGNSFQIEWATKYLTDMWHKNQENKTTNPKTPNGKEEEAKALEARRSLQMAESTDSDSSDNVSYISPSLSLYKRKENGREMERTPSPLLDHDHFSNGSKKTKRSTAPDVPQQKGFSDMEMLHKSSNIVTDRTTDSSLKMSDCKLSNNDPRSGRTHSVQSPNHRGSYETRRQNLSDIEKSKSLSKASHVPHSRISHFKSGMSREQTRVPMVFNNYNSDSDEDGDVGSRSPIGFSTRKTQMMRRPPHPPRPRDPPIVHPRPSRSFQPGMSLSQTDFPDLALEYESPVGSVIVKLAMGDILTQKTDAIISPASTDLMTFFGISAVIAKNADRKMKEECANYVTQNGNLLFGDVIHTCAGGNLDPKVTYILHVAVPTWREDIPEQSAHLLTCTYLNCFQYAEKIWLRSLSMPIIGAGYFGAPLDACVQSFHDAILLFTLFHKKKAPHLQEVHLVSNGRDSACSSVVVFKSLMDLEEEQARKAAIERYCKGSEMYDFSARDFVLTREESSGDERQSKNESDSEERSNDVAENKMKYSSNQKLDSECSAKKEYSSANSTDSDENDQSFPAKIQIGRKENASDSKNKENTKTSHDDERDLWEDVKNENRSTNDFSFEESEPENVRDRDLHQMKSRVSLGESASFSTEYTEMIDDTASSSVIEKLLTRRGSD